MILYHTAPPVKCVSLSEGGAPPTGHVPIMDGKSCRLSQNIKTVCLGIDIFEFARPVPFVVQALEYEDIVPGHTKQFFEFCPAEAVEA